MSIFFKSYPLIPHSIANTHEERFLGHFESQLKIKLRYVNFFLIVHRELTTNLDNSRFVKLQFSLLMGHSMLSTVSMTRQASAVHVIMPYIFECL